MARSLIRNTLLYLPAQLLGPFVQFAVVVTWTHLLDPGAFGVVTFVVAAQELTALFGLIWWSIFVLRFRQRYAGVDIDRFRAMDSRMVFLGAASQIAMAPLCLLAIGVGVDAATVAASAAYLIARLLLVHYSEWARSEHQIAAYSFAQIVGPVLGSILSVVAVLEFGPSPAVALAAMAVGQSVGAARLMFALGIRSRVGTFDRAIFDDARRYGAPLIAGGLFGWAAINGVRILVQYGEGVVGVGLFSAGWGLGQRIANVIAMLCTTAAFPIAVDKIESGDREGALGQVSLNGVLMFGLLAPATTGVALLAAPIVNLMIAADYRAITIYVLPIAAAAGAVRTLKTHIADQSFLLLDATKATMASNFADAVVTLICAAIGLMLGGILGAAIGCLVGAIVAAMGALAFAVFRQGLPVEAGAYLKIVAASAIMGLAIFALPAPAGFVALGLAIAVGGLTYATCVVLLFPQIRTIVRDRVKGMGRDRAAGV
jgi:O-antigen/teichoic acid export membrane protein